MTIFSISNAESGASVRAKLNAKLGPVIDVMADFGAVGDGFADDTAAIQDAFDAAFGTTASPHGSSFALNRPVFFPNGLYKVTCPATTKTITAAADDGATNIRLTLNNVTGLVNGMHVNVTGSTGTNIDGGWTLGSVNSPAGTVTLTNTLYSGNVTGGSLATCALTIPNVQGAHIYGAGRFTTKIRLDTVGGTLFATDGFTYSVMERIYFEGQSSGETALLLNHFTSGYRPVQSLSFNDIYISGFGRGVTLASGHDGSSFGQGSEMVFSNCYWQSCSVYGIAVCNANALQISLIGGNFQGCAIGVDVIFGSINLIQGVGFQTSTDCDIKIENNASNTMVLVGCRSESDNFINNIAGQDLTIMGCHTSYNVVSRGYFLIQNGGVCFMAGCYLGASKVKPAAGTRMCITASEVLYEAVAHDWLDTSGVTGWRVGADNGGDDPQLVIELNNVLSYVGNGTTQDSPKVYNQRIYSTDQTNVTIKNHPMTVYSGVSASDTVTAAASNNAFVSFAQSYSIPAETLSRGTRLRITAMVAVNNASGADTLTCNLRLGSTSLIATTAVDPGATTDLHRLEFEVVARAAPGATASCVGSGRWTTDTGAVIVNGTGLLAPTNFATNGALVVTAQAKWSSNTASTSARLEMLNVEIL